MELPAGGGSLVLVLGFGAAAAWLLCLLLAADWPGVVRVQAGRAGWAGPSKT